MGLDFESESIESARARWKTAIAKQWQRPLDGSIPDDRPGLHRDHVFDTYEEYRVRMIVSKQQLPEDMGGDVSILVTAIMLAVPGVPACPDPQAHFRKIFEKISGMKKLVFVALSDDKIAAHYIAPIEN